MRSQRKLETQNPKQIQMIKKIQNPKHAHFGFRFLDFEFKLRLFRISSFGFRILIPERLGAKVELPLIRSFNHHCYRLAPTNAEGGDPLSLAEIVHAMNQRS